MEIGKEGTTVRERERERGLGGEEERREAKRSGVEEGIGRLHREAGAR